MYMKQREFLRNMQVAHERSGRQRAQMHYIFEYVTKQNQNTNDATQQDNTNAKGSTDIKISKSI